MSHLSRIADRKEGSKRRIDNNNMFDTNPNSKKNIEDRERIIKEVKRIGGVLPRPPYQIYSDLGVIDPWSIKTCQDLIDYNNSLFYGCQDCDKVSTSHMAMVIHHCLKNGKSKYEQHQQEALNRKIEKMSKVMEHPQS